MYPPPYERLRTFAETMEQTNYEVTALDAEKGTITMGAVNYYPVEEAVRMLVDSVENPRGYSRMIVRVLRAYEADAFEVTIGGKHDKYGQVYTRILLDEEVCRRGRTTPDAMAVLLLDEVKRMYRALEKYTPDKKNPQTLLPGEYKDDGFNELGEVSL